MSGSLGPDTAAGWQPRPVSGQEHLGSARNRPAQEPADAVGAGGGPGAPSSRSERLPRYVARAGAGSATGLFRPGAVVEQLVGAARQQGTSVVLVTRESPSPPTPTARVALSDGRVPGPAELAA